MIKQFSAEKHAAAKAAEEAAQAAEEATKREDIEAIDLDTNSTKTNTHPSDEL